MKELQKVRESLIADGFKKDNEDFSEVFVKTVDVKDGDAVDIIVKLDYVLKRKNQL